MERFYVGIEIGGTKLQILTGDATANVQQRFRFTVDASKGADGIRAQIQATIQELQKCNRLSAIGVGFGGPVDWKTGKICKSHHIEGWSEFELGEWLRGLTGVPVIADNDANVAALGEATIGAGKGFNPVFYVTLGSGVGGGLVVDGKIYHGARPGESEIGHVRLEREGTLVEDRCSGWAMDKKIRALKASNPGSLLFKLIGDSVGGEAKHLGSALQQGDRLAQQILNEAAGQLAFALSHVVHLFHPEVIVIGGGLSLIGEPLRVAVERTLTPLVMDAFASGPQVCLASLSEEAVPIGSLLLAHRHLQA